MTNDEAINTLKNTAWLGSEEQAEKVSEAVRMAVEALKRETSGDAIDRQAAIRIASGYCHPANVAKELAKLPSVQPDVPDTNVGDLISRQAAIDICHKNYDGILDFRSDGWTVASSFEDIINSVPSVQPGIIHCRDCISYQEGIDINGKPFTRCNGSVRTYGHTLPDWYCADAERRTDGRD